MTAGGTVTGPGDNVAPTQTAAGTTGGTVRSAGGASAAEAAGGGVAIVAELEGGLGHGELLGKNLVGTSGAFAGTVSNACANFLTP